MQKRVDVAEGMHKRVIIADEPWCCWNILERMIHYCWWSMDLRVWHVTKATKTEKTRQTQSKTKILLTVFINCGGVAHNEFLLEGGTRRGLREIVPQKGPDLSINNSRILHLLIMQSLFVSWLLKIQQTLLHKRRIVQICHHVTF